MDALRLIVGAAGSAAMLGMFHSDGAPRWRSAAVCGAVLGIVLVLGLAGGIETPYIVNGGE